MTSERMRAVVLEEYGDPSVLRCKHVERPEAREGELLVRIRACGVCGHDLLSRRGALGTPVPQILGHEIAGEVVDTGRVDTFKIGDRVVLNQRVSCGRCAVCLRGAPNLCTRGDGFYGEEIPGGYAEYVRAKPLNTVPIRGIPFEVAAALPCAVGTGLHAVHHMKLQRGETVVVTGANGGVGIHTVALARLFGAVVIGVIRDPGMADEIHAAGAHEVVVLREGGFHGPVRQQFPDGVDAVIENVGTPTFASSLRCLRPGGRIVVVGNVRPETIQINLGLFILKELNLIGSAHVTPSELAEAVDLVETGRITPKLSQVFPLEEAARAHALAEGGARTGRIVLTMP